MRTKSAVTVALVALFLSWQGIVGSDCYWLVAIGDWIIANGSLPDGVPFAAASSAGWPNPLVLSQIGVAVLARGGAGLLLLAQVAVIVVSLALVSRDARRLRAGDVETSFALLLLGLGGLASFAVVRLQAVSLIPFAVLVALLRQEHRRPSWRIWLVVPLVVLWGNLHGAVVVGVAVIGGYLLLSRLRHSMVTAVGVGLASLAALNANPAGFRTWLYYRGVFANEAAQRGTELWARPSVENPFDWMLVGSACVLVALALRARRPVWEYVVMACLVMGTVLTARNGFWLLFFCAAPAAAGMTAPLRRRSALTAMERGRVGGIILFASICAVALISGQRGDSVAPVPQHAVAAVVKLSAGQVLLAPEPAAESFAAAGATVWLANPIDAFDRDDQAAYLDFVSGGPSAGHAVSSADLVVVKAGSRLANRMEQRAQLQDVPGARGWKYFRPTRR